MRLIGTLMVAVLCLGAAMALAETDPSLQIRRGHQLAETLCAGCHAIGPDDASPVADAPAFRDLGHDYPVEELSEALAEGIITGHEDMPEVVLEPDDIAAFLAYLKSVQK